MMPNEAGRSPRTGHEPPIKRGANTADLTSRLARDHPQVLARLQAGEFPSVRAAAKAAGLIPEWTPLEQLERAWRRAPPEDRAAFLALRQSATPPPPRLRRLTGAIWHERMVLSGSISSSSGRRGWSRTWPGPGPPTTAAAMPQSCGI
jgi:hypothetical protein